MATLASKVSIISQAFTLLGKGGINTLDTTNKLHTSVSQRYDTLIPALLTQSRWKHAGKTAVLDLLTDEPPTGEWSNTFQLPNKAEMLLAYRVYPDNFTYEIMQDKLYTNESEVTLFYIHEPTPNQFPVYFTNYLVYSLASEIAMAVTNKLELVELWAKKAIQAQAVAMAADAQQAPNVPIRYDGLVGAHLSGGSRRGVSYT